MSEPSWAATASEAATREPAAPAYELIELFFFAYRDFVADADRVLGEFGFGRAHHRVLHFVARRPGLPVADLLDVLQITKQSLNRVLKELIGTGYVRQRAGTADRRQRLLFPTEEGRELAARLARLQTRRIRRALAAGPADESEAAVRRFLLGMIDGGDPTGMRPLASGGNPSE
ncbi:MarR family transcriptional regulator [Enterovirga sp.]|uniref:MarR family winged helix-turn-helix transcriptional regulator n=1 Tax=Enterovirga sp. TaxID=2026350 RepID=UPI0026364D5C|nr:MarR family transcriptional regulator [Enterovirga sp.]